MEGALKGAGERLESQISASTPQVPCIVGQYLPLCSCEEHYEKWNEGNKGGVSVPNGLNGLNGRNGWTPSKSCLQEENRCPCGPMNSRKWGLTVWAAATASKAQHGGCVPRLSYVMVEGTRYVANTHVSVSKQM